MKLLKCWYLHLTQVRLLPYLALGLTDWFCWDLADVTLADEDADSQLIDNVADVWPRFQSLNLKCWLSQSAQCLGSVVPWASFFLHRSDAEAMKMIVDVTLCDVRVQMCTSENWHFRGEKMSILAAVLLWCSFIYLWVGGWGGYEKICQWQYMAKRPRPQD